MTDAEIVDAIKALHDETVYERFQKCRDADSQLDELISFTRGVRELLEQRRRGWRRIFKP